MRGTLPSGEGDAACPTPTPPAARGKADVVQVRQPAAGGGPGPGAAVLRLPRHRLPEVPPRRAAGRCGAPPATPGLQPGDRTGRGEPPHGGAVPAAVAARPAAQSPGAADAPRRGTLPEGKDGFGETLRERAVFKFIIGIHNDDLSDVRFFTQVYALAGADIVAVAARPNVVAAARKAMAEVRGHVPGEASTAKIMVSLALEHDPHVEGVALPPEHRACIVPAHRRGLRSNIRACLDEGADLAELHASNSGDPALRHAVEALSPVLGDRYLSVCLGTGGWRSAQDAARQATLARSIHGPKTMIQAEGITLARDGSPACSLQGLALAQVLLACTSAYVLVAGGVNEWTRGLTDILGIPVHGIASGSYARSLVEGYRHAGAGALGAAVRVARRFVRHAKGVPCDDV